MRFLATPDIRREPSASTRACSTASNTPRACGFPGISLRCSFGSWQASFSAIESAWPRTIAASRLVILRAGSGSRALPGARPGRSDANVTSSSGAFAIARRQAVTARLNGSVGASLVPVRNFVFDVVISFPPPVVPAKTGTHNHGRLLLTRSLVPSPHRTFTAYGSRPSPGRRLGQCHVDRRFRQLGIEAALIEFGHQRPLQLIAFVQKGDAEGEADVVENIGILRPSDH